MKKLFYLIFIIATFSFSADSDELINIGDITFQSMNWNDYGDIFYSRRNIQDMTSRGEAVVIHFFTACFS
ncbi:MAG: hypothetical protein KAS62_06070 [Candidatus Delongbacteria bacterium]|nr:hypothetical protein [Candidatus Delongbacteria bacterium]